MRLIDRLLTAFDRVVLPHDIRVPLPQSARHAADTTLGDALRDTDAERILAAVRMFSVAVALGVPATLGLTAAPAAAQNLLNVSYDPTREFYREYNEWFADWWEAQGNPRPDHRDRRMADRARRPAR